MAGPRESCSLQKTGRIVLKFVHCDSGKNANCKVCRSYV
jgi:hypothetical protein